MLSPTMVKKTNPLCFMYLHISVLVGLANKNFTPSYCSKAMCKIQKPKLILPQKIEDQIYIWGGHWTQFWP